MENYTPYPQGGYDDTTELYPDLIPKPRNKSWWPTQPYPDTEEVYYTENHFGMWIQFLWSSTSLLANILCLFGALKRIRCLLYPYIVVNSLCIVLLIIGAFLLLIFGTIIAGGSAIEAQKKGHDIFGNGTHVLGLGVAAVFFLVLVPLSIGLGLYIYFLVIVVQFDKEISRGRVSNQQEGIVLQPYNVNHYLPQQGTQIQTGYIPQVYPQQQPPPYVYPQPPTYAFPQQGIANPSNK